MSETKHTPGPWRAELLEVGRRDYPDWNTFTIRAENNVCLAVVGEIDRYYEQDTAKNARLISAAPDLLEIVKELWDSPNDFPKTYAFWERVKKAIAKAEGRE